MRRKESIRCFVILLGALGVSLLAGATARATTTNFNFNTDPSAYLDVSGSAVWSPSGGVGSATNSDDGFLIVTPAVNSQSGKIVFADFDEGSVVQGFTFECDMRIGNGTQTPADGFSVSYCRANDPALTGSVWAGNGPEEGTTTGIAVGFDAYENSTDDPVALDVWVDGVQVLKYPMPIINGTCSDHASLQTGAWDGTTSDANLCWAHLKVVLAADAKLSVYWKGFQILTNYQTTYFPSPSRLIFAGRTGGLNQNQEVDNIAITTIPASLALVGQATAFPDGFAITISDSGKSLVNPATVAAKLNGASVTLTSVTKNGATTTATYHGFPLLLPAGTTNSLLINCLDVNGNSISETRTFVQPSYPILPAGDAVTGVNTGLPGFTVQPWQSAGQPNRIYWMLEQLAGLHGANEAAFTVPQSFTGVVNFNITPASSGGGDAGNFQTGSGYADVLFPGIPGANALNGSTALNIQCYLQFPHPGLYTLGVNSDDGFLVSEGKNPNDYFAQWLGSYDGGRGASDTTFTIVVTNAGIYPVRLAWENGNGESGNGANCEWFTVQDGVKYLINDPDSTNATGIKAFYSGPALPAFVSHINPYFNATGCRADTLLAQLTDAGTTVSGSSIQLSVDGTAVPFTTAKSGKVTTVRGNFGVNIMLPGLHTAALVWNDGGPNHTNSWSFTVDKWVTLDVSLATAISNVSSNEPGFKMQVTQLDPEIARPGASDKLPNQVDSTDALLGGLYFPWYSTNTADPLGGSLGEAAAVTNMIGESAFYTWHYNDAMDFAVNGSQGDFPFNHGLPGIPGLTGKDTYYGVWIDGYVVFPAAGYYRMSISSDDGFRVAEGLGITRQLLHVDGPRGINTDIAAVATYTNNGNAYGADLPLVPVTAPVVYINYGTVCPPPPTNLIGKIAVINNFQCYDAEYISAVAAGGAVGAILMNDPSFGLPYVLGGTPSVPINIPVLTVNGFGGQEDFWRTNSGLVATIGRDTHLQLGISDIGRGMGWTDFGFLVPQAGAYPMHVTHWNGNGGAGFEWAVLNPDVAYGSTRVIMNDASTPGTLVAFRSAVAPARFALPSVSGGILTLKWSGSGTLQSATQISPGNWADVTPQPAGNSYSTPATGIAKYYRLK